MDILPRQAISDVVPLTESDGMDERVSDPQ